MTPATGHNLDAPVRKSVTVQASVEEAFETFTAGVDGWWPRTHHIGKAPMTKAVMEQRAGGRCYSEQADGTECDWGQILLWEPPQRFVMAWQVNPNWQYEPDVAKSSEVEVRFTAEAGGRTRVDLEHRYFERHRAGWETMRSAIDSDMGWNGMLRAFQARAEQQAATGDRK